VTVDNIYAVDNLVGLRVVNRGALLREYVDVLTWKDTYRNTTDTKFRVYVLAGGQRQLLAELNKGSSSGPFRYLHRGLAAGAEYTYSVVAVGSQDREGEAASVTVR
jgi:hypothetical protein